MRSRFVFFSLRCIIKRQANLADHVPGCLYPNVTTDSATKEPHLAGDVQICDAPPQFEHDPAQVFDN